jgi:hypothetical protein
MIRQVMRILHRPRSLAAAGIILAGWLVVPNPASARVWFGFPFPFPLVVGPPSYYYPPPAYYYPRPAYYPPPAYYYRAPPAPPYSGYATPYYPPGPHYMPSSQSCVTGGAVCPMEHSVASGSSCYCTTGQGRVWGRAT